jgi:hypothetical protein
MTVYWIQPFLKITSVWRISKYEDRKNTDTSKLHSRLYITINETRITFLNLHKRCKWKNYATHMFPAISRLHSLSKEIDRAVLKVWWIPRLSQEVFYTTMLLAIAFDFSSWRSLEQTPQQTFPLRLLHLILLVPAWVYCAYQQFHHVPGKPTRVNEIHITYSHPIPESFQGRKRLK